MSAYEYKVVSEINRLLAQYGEAIYESKQQDTTVNKDFWTTRIISAIERYAPPNSNYVKDLAAPREKAAVESFPTFTLLNTAYAILAALRDDYDAGYMRSVAEIIHGDVFSDFMDMAEYLEKSEYPVAAAVIAGTVLEEHVRKLCDKNNVSRTGTNGKTKTVDTMNIDLAKAGVYGTTMQKQVTAWYGMRNDAAHGTMAANEYPNVSGMITGINGFLAMYPA